MPNVATMSCSQTYPIAVEAAFDAVLPLPLPELFDRRYGVIPAIRSVEGEHGTWGTPGQTRTIRLAGGGGMREELVRVDRPSSFGYTLSAITGPMRAIASRVDGSWSFAADGEGTRVTWSWTVHPASALTAPALPLFAGQWRGYARRSLAHLGDLITA